MNRISVDPYEDSPGPIINFDNWERVHKTRWSGNDYCSDSSDSDNPLRKKPKTCKTVALLSNDNASKRRRTRWGSKMKTRRTEQDMRQFSERLEAINKIDIKLNSHECIPDKGDPYLDLPEPNPEYDITGKRTNTLELRYKAKLERDRNHLIYQLIQLNPTYTPPSNYKYPGFQKIVWMPTKRYPGVNFIGAVLGPRGANQKKLEQASGCRIAVRGRGAEKNIVRVMKNPRTNENVDMHQHVHIHAPSEKELNMAVNMITQLFKPQSDQYRAEQMKALAIINGTMSISLRCNACGEFGHKDVMCPKNNTYFSNVKCNRCGDISHITSDCPSVDATGKDLDEEYQEFIKELTGSTDPISKSISSGSKPPITIMKPSKKPSNIKTKIPNKQPIDKNITEKWLSSAGFVPPGSNLNNFPPPILFPNQNQ